jgi:hypothetical protein
MPAPMPRCSKVSCKQKNFLPSTFLIVCHRSWWFVGETFILCRLEAIEVVAPELLELKVVQHLVERSVLQHKHDEVLDLLEVVSCLADCR